MSRRRVAVVMAVMVLAFLSALIALSLQAGSDPYQPTTDDPEIVFREACARCHGDAGRGGKNEGPRLAGERAPLQEVTEHVTEGKGKMPRFPNIQGKVLENLAHHVHGL